MHPRWFLSVNLRFLRAFGFLYRFLEPIQIRDCQLIGGIILDILRHHQRRWVPVS